MANLYFVTDKKSRDSLRNSYRRGELFRIRQGIYVDSSGKNDVENILNQQWYKIAKYLFEDAIAVFRTAVELRPVEGRIYLMVRGLKRRTVTVGPLQFVVDSGIVDKGMEPFVPEMNRSNLPRSARQRRRAKHRAMRTRFMASETMAILVRPFCLTSDLAPCRRSSLH